MKQSYYIKNKNRKWLFNYFILHIVIFALFTGYADFSILDADQVLAKARSPQGFVFMAAAILIVVMEGIFSNRIKEVVVFWRLKNRLPGHRAFSYIGPRDPRIDMNKFKHMFPHGPPSNPQEQNAEWYRLFRQHQDKVQVFQSHKAFLLTRDLTSLTIVFIPLGLFGHFLLENKIDMIFYHLMLLFVLYGIISFAARNYGERFVANVLVAAGEE